MALLRNERKKEGQLALVKLLPRLVSKALGRGLSEAVGEAIRRLVSANSVPVEDDAVVEDEGVVVVGEDEDEDIRRERVEPEGDGDGVALPASRLFRPASRGCSRGGSGSCMSPS